MLARTVRALALVTSVVLSTLALAGDGAYTLSARVYDNAELPFTPHVGGGAFDSYLAMDVQYAPVAALRQQLEADLPYAIQNRGEAHVTVVTPVEFYQALRGKVSMQEINQFAQRADLQASKFEVVCVGKGSLVIDGKQESTYYLVVRSLDLLALREEIEALYLARGGDPEKFEAEKFFPHMTVGYTKRDLHYEDGVVKDESSCIAPVEII